jgi:pimeloyl-ACP methyl ester carboxylesterase
LLEAAADRRRPAKPTGLGLSKSWEPLRPARPARPRRAADLGRRIQSAHTPDRSRSYPLTEPDAVRDRIEDLDDVPALLMKAFVTPSKASQAAGRAYLERLESRVEDRDTSVSKQSALAQLAARREWGTIPPSDRFAMLRNIHHPTLIVQGNKDVVLMINAFLMAEHLPDAQLIVYPDASHGAQSQHAEIFLERVNLFLKDRTGCCVGPAEAALRDRNDARLCMANRAA